LASATAPGLRFSVLRQEVLPERFAVKLTASQGEGRLALELHYHPALLDARDAGRLVESLRRVVESVAQDPGAVVADLEILGDADRTGLLAAFNDTGREVPRLRLHELFEQQVGQMPGETAVVCAERSLTYGELDSRANRLARHLRSLGVGPDTLVALCLDRSPEILIAMLAVLKAGGAYLPLDTENPPDRLAFLVTDAQPAVLVTAERFRDRVPGELLPRVLLDTDHEAIALQPQERPAVAVAEDNLAYVLYTS
ncbi:MAG TPA: non-ribosomal peptide synthetase, partial [Acidobacteria bacterium]|nr:non-ribosomal peptide synthetase [Acidobacteriota bacterium]